MIHLALLLRTINWNVRRCEVLQSVFILMKLFISRIFQCSLPSLNKILLCMTSLEVFTINYFRFLSIEVIKCKARGSFWSQKMSHTIAPKLLYGRKKCDLATLFTPLVIHTLLYSRKWPRSPHKTLKNPPVSSWRCDSVATSTNLKISLQSFPQFY